MKSKTKSAEDLRREIERLGPWHLEVDVTPEVSTRSWTKALNEEDADNAERVPFIDPRPHFEGLARRVYPKGLEGRSFLDCACNCGGYTFVAKDLGAGRCFGFDVREHWIDQARFLLRHRTVGRTDGIRFEACDLYDLPGKGLQTFDITLFKGILYHLPDPITGLKIAADLTSELMIINTATRNGLADGFLAVHDESREMLMSGVYGLSWLPTGPEVVSRILKWAGFVETHVTLWRHEATERLGRAELVASKKHGLLDMFRTSG
jgi:SAM-dependent methyltransferase